MKSATQLHAEGRRIRRRIMKVMTPNAVKFDMASYLLSILIQMYLERVPAQLPDGMLEIKPKD